MPSIRALNFKDSKVSMCVVLNLGSHHIDFACGMMDLNAPDLS